MSRVSSWANGVGSGAQGLGLMIAGRMQRIDPTRWPRRHIYEWYRGMDLPHLSATVEVDVTAMFQATKARGGSLFAAMLLRLARAANTVPELRQRIRVDDGEYVVEHERCDPAFTVAAPDGLFNFATADVTLDEPAFHRLVGEVSAQQGVDAAIVPFESFRDDVLFLSCLPWLRFTQISHPVRTRVPDTIPRIAWGRIVSEGGRRVAPVNLQAHHALVDGGHLGQFFAALEAELTSPAPST